jgi:hypothetical protein
MNPAYPCSNPDELNISENDTPKSIDNNVDYTIDIPLETDNNYDIENDMNSKIDKALGKTHKSEKSKQNSDTNSIEQHLNDVIKKLRERVIIYEYLCFRTNSLYSILNKCFLVPSILLSSSLALFNSNYFKSTEDNNIVLFNVIGTLMSIWIKKLKIDYSFDFTICVLLI